jgi:hypothetical protein
MREKIRKYKIYGYIIGIVLSIFFSLHIYFSFNFNFNEIIEKTLKKYAGLNVKFEKLSFSGIGEIELKNVILKDKKGNTLVKTPTLIIKYDRKNLSQITEIKAKNAIINFEMYGDYNINFVDSFKSKEKDNKEQSILKKIVIEDSTFFYKDKMHTKEIYKKLEKMNGTIDFKENSEVIIKADGKNKKESYAFNMIYKNSNSYEIGINLKNILVDNIVMQYGYTSEDIDYKSGIANLDLKIKPNANLFGTANIINGVVAYRDITEYLTNSKAEVFFKGKEIEIDASGYIKDRKSEININYNLETNLTKILIDLKDIDIQKEKNIYRQLKDIKIPLTGKIDILKIDIEIDKLKKTTLKAGYIAQNIIYGDYVIEKIEGDAEYSSENIILKNNKISIRDYISANINLNGKIKDSNFKGDYFLNNIVSITDLKELNGSIDYKGKTKKLAITAESRNNIKARTDIDIQKGIVKATLKSTYGLNVFYKDKRLKFIGEIDGDYFIKKDELLFNIRGEKGSCFEIKKEKINFNINSLILLKPKKNKIINGKGNVNIEKHYGIDSISTEFILENNFVNFENSILRKGKSFAYLKGYYSLLGGKYAFNLLNSEIELKDIIKEESLEGVISLEGIISGNSLNEAEVMIELKSESGKYKEIEYKKIYTTLNMIYKNGKININGIGEAKESRYKNEKLEELNFNFRYKDNTIYIDNLYNNSLTLKGYYNIISKNMDFDFGVRKYKIENIGLIKEKKIQGYVENITGKAEGNINSPKVKAEVKNMMLSYDTYKNILLNGMVSYENGEIKTEKFKINQNSISGKYGIKNGEIEAKINLFENNLGRYFGLKDIKLRSIGEIIVWGNTKDIKAAGSISSDNFFYKDKKIPEMLLKFTYSKGDIENIRKTGILSISAMDILTPSKEKIVSGAGFVNFENDTLDFKIKNYDIDISKIEYIKAKTNNTALGNLNVNFNLKGSFDKFSYNAELISKKIKLYDTDIDGIKVIISGNKDGIELKQADINYSGNRFYSSGNLKYSPFSYDIKLSGKKIELKILNLFTKGKVKNITGQADIDFNINSKDSYGNITVKNTGFETDEIKVKDLNIRAALEKNKLELYEVIGNINDGKISCFGEILFSNIQPEKFERKTFKAEEWNITLNFDNIKYKIGDYLTLYLGGKMNVKNKTVIGNLEIKNGELRGISSFKEDKNSKRNLNIPEDWKADINIEINKKFKLNINKFSIIEGFESNLEGNGRVKLENGNINFLGTISTEKGVIEVNKNLFQIETGVIVFDDPLQYYPELNPSLAITAVTDVAKEEITVRIGGYLKSPNIGLTSSSSLENDDILSLLAFHKTLSDATPKGVIIDVLERQLNEEIFNPISKKLSKTLGIERVKISSNILEKSEEELKFTKDIRLGASVEFRDKIYKDTLYWNLKTKLSDKTAGELDSFNIWIDYKVLDWLSVSTGVEKKADAIEERLNLHIGIDIKKKVDFKF